MNVAAEQTYTDDHDRTRCAAHQMVLYQQRQHAEGALKRHSDPPMEMFPCRRVKGWHLGRVNRRGRP